jgi:hypothetical protein
MSVIRKGDFIWNLEETRSGHVQENPQPITGGASRPKPDPNSPAGKSHIVGYRIITNVGLMTFNSDQRVKRRKRPRE